MILITVVIEEGLGEENGVMRFDGPAVVVGKEAGLKGVDEGGVG